MYLNVEGLIKAVKARGEQREIKDGGGKNHCTSRYDVIRYATKCELIASQEQCRTCRTEKALGIWVKHKSIQAHRVHRDH